MYIPMATTTNDNNQNNNKKKVTVVIGSSSGIGVETVQRTSIENPQSIIIQLVSIYTIFIL